MTLVLVDQEPRPAAYLEGKLNKVFLGLTGNDSSPVNIDYARAEAVAPFAHTALELTIKLLDGQLKHLKADNFDAVATAILVTNTHLPKELQHGHLKLLKEIVLDEPLEGAQFRLTDSGLGWTAGTILGNTELYGGEDEAAVFALALANFHLMLADGGIGFDAKNYLINNSGKLQYR